jgi:hypothetical protein
MTDDNDLTPRRRERLKSPHVTVVPPDNSGIVIAGGVRPPAEVPGQPPAHPDVFPIGLRELSCSEEEDYDD